MSVATVLAPNDGAEDPELRWRMNGMKEDDLRHGGSTALSSEVASNISNVSSLSRSNGNGQKEGEVTDDEVTVCEHPEAELEEEEAEWEDAMWSEDVKTAEEGESASKAKEQEMKKENEEGSGEGGGKKNKNKKKKKKPKDKDKDKKKKKEADVAKRQQKSVEQEKEETTSFGVASVEWPVVAAPQPLALDFSTLGVFVDGGGSSTALERQRESPKNAGRKGGRLSHARKKSESSDYHYVKKNSPGKDDVDEAIQQVERSSSVEWAPHHKRSRSEQLTRSRRGLANSSGTQALLAAAGQVSSPSTQKVSKSLLDSESPRTSSLRSSEEKEKEKEKLGGASGGGLGDSGDGAKEKEKEKRKEVMREALNARNKKLLRSVSDRNERHAMSMDLDAMVSGKGGKKDKKKKKKQPSSGDLEKTQKTKESPRNAKKKKGKTKTENEKAQSPFPGIPLKAEKDIMALVSSKELEKEKEKEKEQESQETTSAQGEADKEQFRKALKGTAALYQYLAVGAAKHCTDSENDSGSTIATRTELTATSPGTSTEVDRTEKDTESEDTDPSSEKLLESESESSESSDSEEDEKDDEAVKKEKLERKRLRMERKVQKRLEKAERKKKGEEEKRKRKEEQRLKVEERKRQREEGRLMKTEEKRARDEEKKMRRASKTEEVKKHQQQHQMQLEEQSEQRRRSDSAPPIPTSPVEIKPGGVPDPVCAISPGVHPETSARDGSAVSTSPTRNLAALHGEREVSLSDPTRAVTPAHHPVPRVSRSVVFAEPEHQSSSRRRASTEHIPLGGVEHQRPVSTVSMRRNSGDLARGSKEMKKERKRLNKMRKLEKRLKEKEDKERKLLAKVAEKTFATPKDREREMKRVVEHQEAKAQIEEELQHVRRKLGMPTTSEEVMQYKGEMLVKYQEEQRMAAMAKEKEQQRKMVVEKMKSECRAEAIARIQAKQSETRHLNSLKSILLLFPIVVLLLYLEWMLRRA